MKNDLLSCFSAILLLMVVFLFTDNGWAQDGSSEPSQSSDHEARQSSFSKQLEECEERDKRLICPPQKTSRWELRGSTGVMFYSYKDGLTERAKGWLPFWGVGLLGRSGSLGHSRKEWLKTWLEERLGERLRKGLGKWIGEWIGTREVLLDLYYQDSFVITTSGSKTSFLTRDDGGTEPFAMTQDQKTKRKDFAINVGIELFDCDINSRLPEILKFQLPRLSTESLEWFNVSIKPLVPTIHSWLFLGWKYSESTIEGRSLKFAGSVVPTMPVPVTTVPSDTQVHLKTNGFVMGIKFRLQFDPKFPVVGGGTLGINVARMMKTNGEYRYTDTYLTTVEGIPDLSTDAHNKYGQIYGIDWDVPLTSIFEKVTLRLNISGNYSRYKMDTVNTIFPKSGRSLGGFPVKEEIYSGRVSLIAQF